MFPVYINDGQQPLPSDDICYIIAKEGIFLKKKLGVMESIAPVSNISILDSISSTAKLHIRKIPASKFAKVIEFFRAVYNEHHSESIVLLFYDEEKKMHHIVPPYQKVTAGSLDYNRGITIEGMTMIGTIHSHGRMSAFHSGVDDNDEKTFDGLHITVGDVDENEVSISSSIVVNGHRFMTDPGEYVNKLKLTKDIDEEVKGSTINLYRVKNGKLVKDDAEAKKRGGYTYRKYDKRYVVDVSEKSKKFDQEWLNLVEKGVYQRTTYTGYGMQGYSHWGGHFDPTFWNEKYQQTLKPVPTSTIQKTGSDRPAEFPGQTLKVDDPDVYNPCFDCVNRDIKILWAIEQYTEEEEDEPEDYMDRFTHVQNPKVDIEKSTLTDGVECGPAQGVGSSVICGFCGLTYYLLENDSVCPSCGADDPIGTDEDEIEFVECPTCANRFSDDNEVCPFCRTPLNLEAEDMIPNDENIFEEAMRRNENAEKIPDPQKKERLISIKHFGADWKTQMKKVFSKGTE